MVFDVKNSFLCTKSWRNKDLVVKVFGGAKLLSSLILFTPKIETKLRPVEHFYGSVGAATCRFLFNV